MFDVPLDPDPGSFIAPREANPHQTPVNERDSSTEVVLRHLWLDFRTESPLRTLVM
jgi:hypothetical protein